MEIKKHQLKIVFPELHDIIHIIITDHNGLLYPLQRISEEHMRKLQEKPQDGRPVCYSLDNDRHTVTVFPRPDRTYENVSVDYLAPKRSL